jgi:hypothetical protein
VIPQLRAAVIATALVPLAALVVAAFTFDRHFAVAGFEVVPGQGL